MTVAELVEKFPLLEKNLRNGQFDHTGISIIGHGDRRYITHIYSLEDFNKAMEETLANEKIARAWIQNDRYHSTSPARLIKFK